MEGGVPGPPAHGCVPTETGRGWLTVMSSIFQVICLLELAHVSTGYPIQIILASSAIMMYLCRGAGGA